MVSPAVRVSVREHIAIALAHFTGLPRYLAIVSSLGIAHSHSRFARNGRRERYKVVRAQGTRRLGTPLPRAFSIKPAKYPSSNPIDPGGRAASRTNSTAYSLVLFTDLRAPTAAALPLFASPRSHDPVAHPYHAQAPGPSRPSASVCPSLCDVVQNNLTAE